MTIYLLVFSVLCFCWLYVFSYESDKRVNITKKISVFIMLLFVAIAALRGSSVGTDTLSYIQDYNKIVRYSYREILALYSDNPGYFLVSKVFAELGLSVQIWFAFIAFLYVGTISRFINKFSKDQILSYIMFLGLGYYSFSLAGLKQVFAMTLSMWAFLYLEEKKYIRFFLLMFIASVFHVSSLVFVFAFFIAIIRKSKIFYWLLGGLFLVSTLNYSFIFKGLLNFLNNEHYNTYLKLEGAYSPVVFVVQLLILLVSVIFMKRYNNEHQGECRVFIGMLVLGVISQLFAFIVASAFRLSMYFSIFAIVLLPNCFSYIQNVKLRRSLKIGAAFIFILFFVYTNRKGSSVVPYTFFWNSQ